MNVNLSSADSFPMRGYTIATAKLHVDCVSFGESTRQCRRGFLSLLFYGAYAEAGFVYNTRSNEQGYGYVSLSGFFREIVLFYPRHGHKQEVPPFESQIPRSTE